MSFRLTILSSKGPCPHPCLRLTLEALDAVGFRKPSSSSWVRREANLLVLMGHFPISTSINGLLASQANVQPRSGSWERLPSGVPIWDSKSFSRSIISARLRSPQPNPKSLQGPSCQASTQFLPLNMGTVCSVWDDGRLPRMCVSMRVNPSGVRSPDFRAAWLCPRLLELRAHLQEVGVDTVRPPSHIPCAIHMRASYTQRGRPSSDISRGQQRPQQSHATGSQGCAMQHAPHRLQGSCFPRVI